MRKLLQILHLFAIPFLLHFQKIFYKLFNNIILCKWLLLAFYFYALPAKCESVTTNEVYTENSVIQNNSTNTSNASKVENEKQYVNLNNDSGHNLGSDNYYSDLFKNSNPDANLMFAKYKNYNMILKDQDTNVMNDVLKAYIDNGFYQKFLSREYKEVGVDDKKIDFKITLNYIVSFSKSKWSVSINDKKYKDYNEPINGISIISVDKRRVKILYHPNKTIASYILTKKDIPQSSEISIKDNGSVVFFLSTGQCFDVDSVEIKDECSGKKQNRYSKKNEK